MRSGSGRGRECQVVGHNDQVMLTAVAIADVVAQRRFGAKSQQLKDPDRAFLIGHHLRDDFFQAKSHGQREDGFRQHMAEAEAPRRGSATMRISPTWRAHPCASRASTAVPTIPWGRSRGSWFRWPDRGG